MSTSRPDIPSRSRRTRFAALIVSSIGLVATGCGDSSHRYVANKAEKVYLKVPRDWREVSFADTDIDRLEAKTSSATLVWRAAASADPGAKPSGADADFPLVFTAVYELNGELNQNMSASLARVAASPTGFDPLLPDGSAQGDLVEVLDYRPLDFDDMNGSRIVFRSRATAEDDYSFVYDLSAAYDSSAFRLYVLQVGCNVECYENNQEAISDVAGSWLVKP